MGGTASQVDTTRAQLDEEQHVDGLQEEHVNCEEIAGKELFLVMGHQVSPSGRRTALWCRWNTVPSQHVRHSFVAHFITELEKFPLNFTIAPVRVFPRQAHH